MPLFDVDVKGALKLKSIYGRSMKTIFIMPPSVEELRKGSSSEERTAWRRSMNVSLSLNLK